LTQKRIKQSGGDFMQADAQKNISEKALKYSLNDLR